MTDSQQRRPGRQRLLAAADEPPIAAAYRNGATLAELGQRYGVAKTTIRRALHRQGVELRAAGTPHPLDERRKLSDEQRADVARLYVEELWSLRQLAQQFGVERTTIRRILRRLNVPARPAGANLSRKDTPR